MEIKDRKEYFKQWHREFRQRHRTQGLCISCNQKVNGGHSRCLEHQVKQNSIDRRSYQNHKKQGLCTQCGNNSIQGETRCGLCLYKEAIRSHNYYQQNRETHIESVKRCHENYLNNRRCYNCGTPLIEDEDKFCCNCKIRWHMPSIRGVLKYETAN